METAIKNSCQVKDGIFIPPPAAEDYLGRREDWEWKDELPELLLELMQTFRHQGQTYELLGAKYELKRKLLEEDHARLQEELNVKKLALQSELEKRKRSELEELLSLRKNEIESFNRDSCWSLLDELEVMGRRDISWMSQEKDTEDATRSNNGRAVNGHSAASNGKLDTLVPRQEERTFREDSREWRIIRRIHPLSELKMKIRIASARRLRERLSQALKNIPRQIPVDQLHDDLPDPRVPKRSPRPGALSPHKIVGTVTTSTELTQSQPATETLTPPKATRGEGFIEVTSISPSMDAQRDQPTVTLD